MSSAPAQITTPQITTLVIGPQAGGRGYQTLARSDGPPLSAEAEGRLGELALVLAGWADQAEDEPPAIALLPLGPGATPALLLRLAYLGRASLGTSAFAHGLLLDGAALAACGGRPDLLLPLIPQPDGTRGFGAQPLTLAGPLPAPRSFGDWTRLGLEWRDRLVSVASRGDEEPVLQAILATLPPVGGGTRLRGWATTAALPAVGGFVPARDLQVLVLSPDRRRPERSHYLPAVAGAAGYTGEPIALTPAMQAFARMLSVGRIDPEVGAAVGTLRWSPADHDKPPIELIAPAAQSALRRLGGGGSQMRFILELARPRGEALDREFAVIARGLFAQLLERPELEPQHAAFYLKALADAPHEASQAMSPFGSLLLAPHSLKWLRGRSFTRLLELGFAEELTARAGAVDALIDGIGAEEAADLLERLMASDPDEEDKPALVSALLAELADHAASEEHPGWSGLFAAALDWRLRGPAGPDLARLGSRSVVQATYRFARPLRVPLAHRVLRLRETQGGDRREAVRMLGGALEWIRLKGAAA